MLPDPQGRVDAGQQSLTGCFFIAGRTVYLSGKKQAGDELGFQPRMQVAGIEIIILDSVAGTG